MKKPKNEFWLHKTLILITYLFSIHVLAEEQTFSITGLSQALNVDFSIEIDFWSANGELDTEVIQITDQQRSSNGHALFGVEVPENINTVGISGVAYKEDQAPESSVSIIPYKVFYRKAHSRTTNRVAARLRTNTNLIGYFYGRNSFENTSDRKLGIRIFDRSLQKLLELKVLGGDGLELAKWNRIYGDFNAMANTILTEDGIGIRNPFLESAKRTLGEINPEVRMNLYLKFVTTIHGKKLNTKGPSGVATIDEWAKLEIENIITQHFIEVSGRAREYLSSLESRDDLKRCIEFSETVLTVADSIPDLEEKIKPKGGSTRAIDTIRSIMQKVTECVIGEYKQSTFNQTNNARKAALHLTNRDEGQSLIQSYISVYKRLRKEGWVSNSNDRDVEISKYFKEFSNTVRE